jgi:preprotein translocase subunit SecY
LFQKLLNIFRIPDLRNKLLFTVAMLCVYRIGFYVPLPGIDAPAIRERLSQGGPVSAFAMLSNYVSVFSGGDLSVGTLFGLGIMPYISASIIIQLLGTVIPTLEKLRKEGEPGVRKINEWTRYITVFVCLFQAYLYVLHFNSPSNEVQSELYSGVWNGAPYHFWFLLLSVAMLTAGSIFLMWIGEQIEQYGIGNGISLIITAGIVSRIPSAVQDVLQAAMSQDATTAYKESGLSWDFIRNYLSGVFTPTGTNKIGIMTIIFLIVCFVFVVGASIFLTQAQRRIPVQQAKHMRGRRVYGGAKQYLPLRVNHSGVMPIIFASTLISLPIMGLQKILENGGAPWWTATLGFIMRTFQNGGYCYSIAYCLMIIFFSYFWNTVQFQPKEMANQLRDYGSFIPGLRPGKRTADYLENVMSRITYVGSGFLCVIAIIPSIIGTFLLADSLGNSSKAFQVTQFLGGTGLLIVISVMLDFVNRIEANLVMRNYGGFLDDEGEGPTKIKRPKNALPTDTSNPSRGMPT